MIESDFNPEKGDLVEMFPYDGRFEGPFRVIDKYDHCTSGPLLDVERLRDGRVVKGVETYLLRYPKEERVRRTIKRVLTELGSWPDDFQSDQSGPKFDLKSDQMYDGTPRTMVYFHLKPEVEHSLEKTRAWKDFYSKLGARLEPYRDSNWDWIQFMAKEDRSAVSAAS